MAATRLTLHDDVVDAPSIGPKTADRLKVIGIHTVDDLLQASAKQAETDLQQRWITDELFEAWQQQAQLACSIPGLRGIDAQLLVGVGISSVEELGAADAWSVLQLMTEYAGTSDGQRIVRSSRLPDLKRVSEWIQSATAPGRRAA